MWGTIPEWLAVLFLLFILGERDSKAAFGAFVIAVAIVMLGVHGIPPGGRP